MFKFSNIFFHFEFVISVIRICFEFRISCFGFRMSPISRGNYRHLNTFSLIGLRQEFAEAADEGDLRNFFQKTLWKIGNLNMVLSFLLPQDHHPQCVHHPGDIDSLGASRCALETGGAEPEGIHSKRFLFQPQKGISNDLVRPHLHGKGDRTPCRAIPTLVAGKEILSADQLNLLRKFVMNLLSCQFNFHE